jgi:hypothetical protein
MSDLKAIHSANFKEQFGYDVDCHVLNDKNKTAVICKGGMSKALGLGNSGSKFLRHLDTQAIQPYLSPNIIKKIENHIIFSSKGGETHGYDVTVLIDICNAFIRAEKDGKLRSDSTAVKQSHIILSASAKSGIKGLVYALANYNPTAQEIIDSYKLYVQEEAQEHAKRFPDELYRAWYRIYKIPKPEKNNPWKFMHLTIAQVYEPLANSDKKLLQLLRKYKSSDKKGKSNRLHQYLNAVGVDALKRHLGKLEAIALISQNQEEYEGYFKKLFPSNQLELFSEEIK